MKKVTLIAAPEVRLETPAGLFALFGVQAKQAPTESQRQHLAQNKAGRAHIQTDTPPTTQAVVHAVKYVGRVKRPLTLIDGYHRIAHWMEFGCPFEVIIVIVHEVKANTLDDLVNMTAALADTIDGRVAAKTNSDRWCAVLRDAGLVDAKSKASLFGTRANSYFKRVMGSTKGKVTDLIEKTKASIDAHRSMDLLFHACEQSMAVATQAKYFHPGIATALFRQLDKLPETSQNMFVQEVTSLIVKLGARQAVASRIKLNAATQAVFDLLTAMANEPRNAELKAVGNREDFYDAVEAEMKPVLDKLGKYAKKRTMAVC